MDTPQDEFAVEMACGGFELEAEGCEILWAGMKKGLQSQFQDGFSITSGRYNYQGTISYKTGCKERRYQMRLEVKKIMTKKVVCIKKDIPVVDAIRLMVNNNITGIPVVEDDMTLTGILSEQDVLRLFHTYEDEKDRTVYDFMTQPAVHFEEDEPLLDACYCLRDNNIRRVPVTSNGKVVGIVSRSDMLKCILQLWDKEAVPAVGASDNTER